MNQKEPEAATTLGPHRQEDEPWDHYINRRINDAPDADYQDRHQKVQDWVKQHSLPGGERRSSTTRCAARNGIG